MHVELAKLLAANVLLLSLRRSQALSPGSPSRCHVYRPMLYPVAQSFFLISVLLLPCAAATFEMPALGLPMVVEKKEAALSARP